MLSCLPFWDVKYEDYRAIFPVYLVDSFVVEKENMVCVAVEWSNLSELWEIVKVYLWLQKPISFLLIHFEVVCQVPPTNSRTFLQLLKEIMLQPVNQGITWSSNVHSGLFLTKQWGRCTDRRFGGNLLFAWRH